jgi:hypothetical protein
MRGELWFAAKRGGLRVETAPFSNAMQHRASPDFRRDMVEQIGTFTKTLFAVIALGGCPPERFGTKRNV